MSTRILCLYSALTLTGAFAGCAGADDPISDPSTVSEAAPRTDGQHEALQVQRAALASTPTAPVAVTYVVDPADSVQAEVSVGSQAATPRPSRTSNTAGAARRELK